MQKIMLKHCLKAEALVSKDQKVAIVNVQTAAVLAPQVMYWALSSQKYSLKWSAEERCAKFNLPSQKSAGSDGVYDVVKAPRTDADTIKYPMRADAPANKKIAARIETADQPSAYKYQNDRETD
ncbi:MAG: hypothetical protein FRX49_05989 [Trebouxia sp. A1-2]|nr:MAG: hypothetical protein FRX49_05989 [Trebouxia sp. A1-2]